MTEIQFKAVFQDIIDNLTPLDPMFSKTVDENLWDLIDYENKVDEDSLI